MFRARVLDPQGRGLMVSKLITAAVAGFALVAPFAAEAADVPIASPRGYYKAPPRSVMSYYNWGGFYAGFNVGYGWGTSNWDFPVVNTSPKGMMYGITLGYNMQTGNIVYGVEADFDASTMKGNVTCGVAGTCETKNAW